RLGGRGWARKPDPQGMTGIQDEGRPALDLGGLLDVVPVLLEPTVDLLQAVLELPLRFVMKETSGLFDRSQQAILLVPISSLFEHDTRFVSRKVVHPVGEVEKRDFPSGCQ